MKKLLAGVLLVPALALAPAVAQKPSGPGFTLTTTAFEDGGIIPNQYTQSTASPVSPPLEWSHVPAGTESFAVIVDDPDTALHRSTDEVLHWLIFNIPGSSRSLSQGIPNQPNLSDGAIQGKNTGGIPGFRGMGAPAPGPYHHYLFQIFALDTKLNLGPDATREDVVKAMDGHILAKAAMVGRFHR